VEGDRTKKENLILFMSFLVMKETMIVVIRRKKVNDSLSLENPELWLILFFIAAFSPQSDCDMKH
jgi:hypothetical protein